MYFDIMGLPFYRFQYYQNKYFDNIGYVKTLGFFGLSLPLLADCE
jgi:hypothetical protein